MPVITAIEIAEIQSLLPFGKKMIWDEIAAAIGAVIGANQSKARFDALKAVAIEWTTPAKKAKKETARDRILAAIVADEEAMFAPVAKQKWAFDF